MTGPVDYSQIPFGDAPPTDPDVAAAAADAALDRLFSDAGMTQAFLKVGLLGMMGSGKTFTGSEIAIGMVGLCRERGLAYANKPALFFDTETGADWMRKRFEDAGTRLKVSKSRAFSDLLTAVKLAEDHGSILLIDSITHVWREFCDTYKRTKRRNKLEFTDWDVLKGQWAQFTDAFVNSSAHIVLCGRQGFEYDMETDEQGKKQLVKTGVKMKAEGEMGYEPSLLILMERESEIGNLTNVRRVASVLKDRSDTIDGKQFFNPTFKDFLPHVDFLNLGGKHTGVDLSRNSADQFPEDGEARYYRERQQKEICLEEIKEELVRKWPTREAAALAAKANMLELIFRTRAWTAVEAMKLAELKECRNQLWLELRGYSYGQKPPAVTIIPPEQPTQTAIGGAGAPATEGATAGQ